jgi:hypothetical protein
VIARFLRSATNPLVADPSSRFEVRWISLGRVCVLFALPGHEQLNDATRYLAALTGAERGDLVQDGRERPLQRWVVGGPPQ